MVGGALRRWVFNAAGLALRWGIINRTTYHRARNWYEGGFPIVSGDTSYVPSVVSDARFDQNFITRREMLRRMRYWSQNSGIVESILSVGERYTVGPSGLHVAFYPNDWENQGQESDADDSWYDRAEDVVEEAMQSIGFNGESLETLLKVAYRCQKIDGDVVLLKTRKRGQLQVGKHSLNVSMPALQIIEGHRIETPWNNWADEGITVCDGVQFAQVKVDGTLMMQRAGLWVRSGFGQFETNTSWAMVPNDAVFYVRGEHRANQPRSVSDFYAVEQDIHKLEDILMMEMRAQNSQSSRAVKITNASGQLNPLDPKLRAVAVARGQAAEGTDEQFKAMQRMVEFYRKTYGGEVYAVKQGEQVDFQAPNRPSESTLQLFELLINRICAGSKMPRCLVMEKISAASAKSQGTEVRGVLDNADGFFEADFQKWKRLVKGAVIFFMEWAINNDPRVADPPADWRSCIHVQQPKACNVDAGYNAQATTMELASGQTNYDLIYGPRGLSFRREIKKLARQQQMIERLGVNLTMPALLPGQIELTGEPAKQKTNEVNDG